jgi:hypothetical protein
MMFYEPSANLDDERIQREVNEIARHDIRQAAATGVHMVDYVTYAKI